MMWVWTSPCWHLETRGPHGMCLAEIETVPDGYLVRMHGELAGPYGSLEIARQSVERRLEMNK